MSACLRVSTYTLVLSLALAAVIPAHAQVIDSTATPCADAYAEQAKIYLHEAKGAIRRARAFGRVATGTAMVTGAICLGGALTIIPCVTGAAVTFAFACGDTPNFSSLRQWEQTYRIHVLYKSYKTGVEQDSGLVEELAQKLGLPQQEALGEVARLVETGALCQGRAVPVGFDELVRGYAPVLARH